MNGKYLRDEQPDEYAHFLCRWLDERGFDWPQDRVRATVPIVQEKLEKFSQYPDYVRFLFEDVAPPAGLDDRICRAAAERLETVEPWEATAIEEALRALVDELGEKPRQAFQAIRLAVTGTKVSPSLFESLELLGRETSLRRLTAAVAAA
jgi:glutamyl-tRNA synthetase